MRMHICSSVAASAKPGRLRQVCGVCWYVSDDCRCYAVDDIGVVMRSGRRYWMASLGMDLMDRRHIGTYRTRREAVAALREAVPS